MQPYLFICSFIEMADNGGQNGGLVILIRQR